MPGIIVGIDGSRHSRCALDWAIREVAVRQAPLTVLTVHQVTGYWGGAFVAYLDDRALVEQARKMAQEETHDALAKAGLGSQPPSVTVQAVSGLAAGCCPARSATRSPITPSAPSWSSPTTTYDMGSRTGGNSHERHR